ncbi:MAG: dockerin type I domain-containing protein [Phycisphaerae bacterium]
MVWDPSDPDQYPTCNNRLLYYELYDMGQTPEKLLRTVSYTYYDTGDVSNITIKDEDPTGGNSSAYDWHHDLALYYEGGRQMMRMALWDRWTDKDQDGVADPGTYEMAHAREFRHEWAIGGPRERYLTVDPNVCCPGDVDGDGDTDLTDLALLLAAYGSVPGDPNWNPAADFDEDGDVDLSDLAFLLSDYGCEGRRRRRLGTGLSASRPVTTSLAR